MSDGRRAAGANRRASRRATASADLSPRNQRRRTVGARVRRRAGAPTAPGRNLPARKVARAAVGAWVRPGLRVLVLAIEVSAAILLFTSPALAARTVEVTGNHHLSRQDVLRRTHLGAAGSVFLVAPQAAEAALRGDPYVRAVFVRTSLPDRVEISVDEWEPLGLLHRDGHDYLLSPEGSVLGPAAGAVVGPAAGQPSVDVVWAATGPLHTGEHAVSGRLLQDLKRIQAAFPGAYGLTISAINLAADQQLTLQTREGIRIEFGQMVTPEQIDSLDAKLASLKALSTKVDLAHSRLDYVNLMNQSQPVTHAIPSPSPSPTPSPSARPKKP
ncbi:MAG: cell division protein FtsQ/DivIB [Candidatus Dormibacteria bacterium]